MECSNCGARYHISSLQPNVEQEGFVACEICGELILTKESSNYWSAQLIEYKNAQELNSRP